MMFVQRNGGTIVGAYANRQPGYAEENLADDAPELVAFLAPPPAYIALRRAAYPPIGDLADALVHRESGDPQPYAIYIAACLAVKAKFTKPQE